MNDSTDDSPHDSRIVRWQDSIYGQLHAIAEMALAREKPGHSLQPTMLVNDAFMRLLKQNNVDAADRSQVIAAGANIIRRMLVDHARTRKTLKRGGELGRGGPLNVDVSNKTESIDILELDDALQMLATHSPRAAEVVELKFFGGLTGEEIASHLGVSLPTVNSDWRFARAWLRKTLGASSE